LLLSCHAIDARQYIFRDCDIGLLFHTTDILPHAKLTAYLASDGVMPYRSAGSSVTAEGNLTFRKDNLPAQLRDEYAGFRERVLEDAERVISARVAD
jgi:hypothetical protein